MLTRPENPTLGTLHNAISGLSPLRAIVLAFVCGVITIFAFAPFYLWPIYILVVSLLVWLLDGAREKKNWAKSMFTRGWAFGAGFTLASMHWTASPFLVQPEQHIWFIWMPLILLPAGLGLFFGLGSMLAGIFWSKGPGRVFAIVICLALTEALRGIIFGGFPWNWPGMIWQPGEAVSQLASIGGLWGLSILTLLLAAAPAALADYRAEGAALGRISPLLLAAIVFGCGWAWGSQRLLTDIPSDGTAVRIVDVEVDQSQKYPVAPNGDPRETQRLRAKAALEIRTAYLIGTGDDFPEEPRLVIWPEAALPTPLLQDPDTLDAVTLRLGDRTLIAGTARVDRFTSNTPDWYNSLAVLNARSQYSGAKAIYDKHRLVPFGEMAAADFIPFGQTISGILPPALQQLASSGFTPGPPASPIELSDGKSFLPIICYEALFPELIRSTVSDSDFMVNISIDSWFGSGIGPAQHFAQASYRAIETGRPLVRAANLGVSGVVDSFGRTMPANIISKNHASFKLTTIDSYVPNQVLATTYSRYSAIVSFIGIILLFMFNLALRKNSR